jgi:hypothetical protein
MIADCRFAIWKQGAGSLRTAVESRPVTGVRCWELGPVEGNLRNLGNLWMRFAHGGSGKIAKRFGSSIILLIIKILSDITHD